MERNKLEQEIKRTLKESEIVLPPKPYTNTIQNWWFEEDEILRANQKGEILTLDLDVGKYCDLECTFCFADTQGEDGESYLERTTKRIEGIIDEGVELGLKVMKIVGAGEPFIFKNIFRVIGYAKNKGVQTLVFTSGHVIGDDDYARRIFGHGNITSGIDLARRLSELGTSVIVKYLSFDDDLHTKLVRPKRQSYDYTGTRDKGLLRLVAAGLNAEEKTRLGVDSLLLRENYKEAVQLFSLFNAYNIFCFINTSIDCGNTSMNSGNQSILTKDEAQKVAEDLYSYCRDNDVPFDRISPYFCGPPCSQLNHGLFIGDDDTVKACPGGPKIANYEPGKLKEIWEQNRFRQKFKGVIGSVCISRYNKTLHPDFEKRVEDSL